MIDLYYIIKLNCEKGNLSHTVLQNIGFIFTGKLLNCNGSQAYFELTGYSGSLIIIPLGYIEWMVPYKELNEENDQVKN